jgi:flagella basal body P-ring formation protein FlgA
MMMPAAKRFFRLSGWLVRLVVPVLVLVCWGAALASPSARLMLTPQVVVDDEHVCLADIAAISVSDPEKLDMLGTTVVARSPQPGQTRFVGVEYIRLRLKQAGFDTDEIHFDGPRDVRITRSSAALPAERIRQAVDKAIRSRMPWADGNVTISDVQFDEHVKLPNGKLTYRIVPNRHEDYLGATILALHLFVDGQPVRKLWVNATISVMADVVTVVRPLGKHQHVELEDLAIQRRERSDLAADTVSRVEDALGFRTTRMIYPDTVLRSSMLALPPLVRRGDLVKIVADAGPMTITATGMVKQQGRKGEMVRVMNTSSKRIILARVTGPGAVKVDF